MKLLSIFILFNVVIIYSQSNSNNLKFNTKHFEAVDKWVAFPKMKNDTTYKYGYLYINQKRGFIFNYENNFFIKNGHLQKLPEDTSKNKITEYSFTPENQYLLHILSQKEISELKLPIKPKKVPNYNKETIGYLKSIGSKYNLYGANHLAIKALLKAYKLNPNDKSVIIGLTYAYNKIEKYDKTISILKKAIKKEPNIHPYYLYLGVAYKAIKKNKKAKKTFCKGIKITKNNQEKNNLFVHMLTMFYEIKNKHKYKKWFRIYKKYSKHYSSTYKHFNQKLNEWKE